MCMSVYKKYVREYPDLDNGDLADKIEASGEVDGSRASILRGIRWARQQMRDEESPPEQEGEEPTYTGDVPPNPPEFVVDERNGDTYHIDHDTRTYIFVFSMQGKNNYHFIRLPFVVVQAIFEWYAKPHGLKIVETIRKVSQVYMIDTLNKRWFRRMKDILSLTHGSLPFAPHMYEEWTENDLETMYGEIAEAKLEVKLRSGADEFWRKKYEEERVKTIQVEAFMERIEESLEVIDTGPVEPVEQSNQLDPCDLVVVLSDFHVGLAFENDKNKYNFEVFKRRKKRLKEEIADHLASSRRPIDNIIIFVAGDMVDGVMGNMHPEQGQHQDLHGAEQVIHAGFHTADVILFVERLVPGAIVWVEWTPGNHDRVGASRKEDPKRLAGELTYETAKREYVISHGRQDVQTHWNFHDNIVESRMARKTCLLMTHGDRSPKKLRDAVFSHRHPDARYYVYVMGHLHHMEVVEDMDSFLVIGGSMPGTTDYAKKQLGRGARASQCMFEIRDNGPRPVIWLPVDE